MKKNPEFHKKVTEFNQLPSSFSEMKILCFAKSHLSEEGDKALPVDDGLDTSAILEFTFPQLRTQHRPWRLLKHRARGNLCVHSVSALRSLNI